MLYCKSGKMGERVKKFFGHKPRLKKIIGILLVLIGIFAFLTPLTPGSWLAFIGFELLGVDLLFWDKIKKRFWKDRHLMKNTENNFHNVAVFGGGCFWCNEAVFKMLRGVLSVLPGYAGGTTKNPTYEQVSGGRTGHAEVVRIEYDPTLVRYRDLLTVFFGSHDPTTVNRQGNDMGTQYRSVIFYTMPEQKKVAEDFIKEINISNEYGLSVVTELAPLTQFYEAENYHRDYFATHPGNPYCEVVINPKLEKVQKMFADLLTDKNLQK